MRWGYVRSKLKGGAEHGHSVRGKLLIAQATPSAGELSGRCPSYPSMILGVTKIISSILVRDMDFFLNR